MAPAVMAKLMVIALFITAAAAATGYTNHTVGGAAGWFFNATTNRSATSYPAWAADQTFNLGDYIVFNTNTNQTVIQTYNKTTYQSCNTDDSSDNDTFQYDGGSSKFGEALTISIPLTIEGPNYYFSDADDGVQCERGLAFHIDVKHGLGLPPSLNQPPPPPYIEPPSPDTAQSPPVSTVTTAEPPKGNGFTTRANIRLGFCGFLGFLLFFH
ncbi:cucumber peeling cupredoxin-like [Quillaja saponaria]|uniref:Cucumber peeling cupredoxin-like n=1 Tax=Quillaja saponaria TaxID=32244 RepID=A0AAD7PD04_QUISA|nr:cucumber peeling cupredoxin-like [Quillaja saponaria]